jgi:putative alpha-1,2-mannosidase
LYHKIFGNDQAYGGKDKFEAKLDEMFNVSKTTGREQVDVTGLIGQYARKQQVTMAYLYIIGKPEKLLKSTLYLDNFYKTHQMD